MILKIRNRCLLKIEIKRTFHCTLDKNDKVVEGTESGMGIHIELFNRLVAGISWDGRLLPYFCYCLFNTWVSGSKKKWISLSSWRFETYKYFRFCIDLFGWNKNLTPYFRIPKKYLQET